LYRAAQFLPLFSAWGLLLAAVACYRISGRFVRCKKVISGIAVVGLCVVLWNQCVDMNRWFYVDSLKYEDAKNTMNRIAYELERDYDDGVLQYEGSVYYGGYEYEFEINGVTGDILQWEIDD
jgi:hypothetical protein